MTYIPGAAGAATPLVVTPLTVNTTITSNQSGSVFTNAGAASTTIAVGSNGAVLPQGTINVVSTAGFQSSGTMQVTTSAGVQTITYSGTSGGNSFTGCTGGTGTMSTGGAVVSELILALPTAAAGLQFIFLVVASAFMRIVPADGSTTITLGSQVTPGGGFIRSNTGGSTLRAVASDTTHWISGHIDGIWNNNS